MGGINSNSPRLQANFPLSSVKRGVPRQSRGGVSK